MRRSTGTAGPHRLPAELVITLLGLSAFTAFMLVRPLFSGGPYYRPRYGIGTSYNWWLIPIFVPYALMLRAVRRGREISLKAVVAGAAIVAVPLLIAPPQLSQDLYEYLFYAKMLLVHAANPYTVPPHVFAFDPWYRFARWPDSLYTYGPAWLLATEGVVAVSARHLTAAMLLAKSLTLALGAATVWGLVRAVGGQGGSDSARVPFAVAAFALNPLVVSTVALGGHADAALAACFVWAVWADRRRGNPWMATVLLTLASLVKAYAAPVLLAYLIGRWRKR